MEAAVLSAESRGFIDVGGTQHHVYAVGIARQGAAVEDIADRGLQTGVSEVRGATHGSHSAQAYVAADVASSVTVSGGHMLNGAVAERTNEMLNQADAGCCVGAGAIPVAVEDQVDRNRVAFQHRATVIVDAIAGDYSLAHRTLLHRCLGLPGIPVLAVRHQIAVSGL